MPSYERNHREPDKARVFDGGRDDDEAEGSRLPVVIVISLIVLAAFAGVVWLAYNKGVAHGRADVTAPVAQNVTPPALTPRSGALQPRRIKIYQQPAGPEEGAEQEIAVAPPTPLIKPPPPPTLRARPAETKPAAPDTTAPVREARNVVTPAPVTALPPAEAQPGTYLLQIGAYKSADEADAAWKAYRVRHAALLAGFTPDVQRADLGPKGVWYRLRVGSFADKDAAIALCDRLKDEGGVCFPAK